MGSEIKQETNSEKSIKELTTSYMLNTVIFNMKIVMMHLKTLSKLRHVGKYNEYFYQGIELLEGHVDFVLRILDEES